MERLIERLINPDHKEPEFYSSTSTEAKNPHALIHKDDEELENYRAIGDLTHLQELSQAENDGRLVVLPCKVGDTIYQLRKPGHARGPGVSPRIVSCIEIRGRDYAVCHQGMEPCLKRDLGKTWFLTLQEAEGELREEDDNG